MNVNNGKTRATRWMRTAIGMLWLAAAGVVTATEAGVTDGDYYLVAKHSSKALTTFERAGGQVVLGQSDRKPGLDPTQLWTLARVVDGAGAPTYVIRSKRYGSLLAKGDENENGDTGIALQSASTGDDRHWRLSPHLNGYGIELEQSGLTLNVTGASTADDAKVIVYDASLDDNAQWLLYPVSGARTDASPATASSYDNLGKRYQLAPLPSAAREADRTRRMRLMDYQPSGVFVKKGEAVSISVAGRAMSPDGLTVMVGPPNAFETSSPRNDPQIAMVLGDEAQFVATRSGLVYFLYADSGFNPGPLPPINVGITRGGTPVPLYVQGKTGSDAWRNALAAYPDAPFVEIIGARVAITVTMDVYKRAYQDDPGDILQTLDEIQAWYDDLSGLDGSSALHDPSPLRIHYLQDTVTSAAELGTIYMYATDYFVGVPGENMGDLLRLAKLRQAWSIWHETGHKYQQNDWTWDEIVECTVNVYSLWAQAHFGLPSNLETRDPDSGKTRLDLAAAFLARASRDFNDPQQMRASQGSDDELWVRLVMFDQLGRGLGKTFYPRLHKYYREHPLPRGDDDGFEKSGQIQEFILRSSIVSGHDLSRFFLDWGWRITPDTARRLKQLALPPADPQLSRTEGEAH